MFRVIVAIALSTLLFGCQIEARIASDAETNLRESIDKVLKG